MKAAARREIEAEAEAMVAEMRLGVPRDEGDLERSIRPKTCQTATRRRFAGG